MARVAVVTGGTRGIGEAISVALKEAGYEVAANYGGNDEAARAQQKTGIPDRSTSGTSPTSRRARTGSPGSRRISGRSRSWSTTPGSPATPPCIA